MRTLVALILLAVLTACDAAPIPEPKGTSVGTVAVRWAEDSQSGESELSFEGVTPSALLLRDEAEWSDWLDALPAGFVEAEQDAVEAVDLSDAVLVASVWSKCKEYSRLAHLGEGHLLFRVISEEPMTNCYWSPLQVEVREVPLEALGVDRDAVELVDPGE